MQAFVDALCERVHLTKLDEHPMLKNKHGIRPAYVGFGLLVFGATFVVSQYTTYWISMFCGLLFPAYLTFKCLEAGDSEDEEDNEGERKFWLTYWVVFGLVEIIESIFQSVLFKLPLYNIIKLAFLIYLQHPSSRGAISIYEKTLRDVLKQHEQDIDDHLQSLRRFSRHKKMFTDVIKSAKKQAIERIVN